MGRQEYCRDEFIQSVFVYCHRRDANTIVVVLDVLAAHGGSPLWNGKIIRLISNSDEHFGLVRLSDRVDARLAIKGYA